MREHLLSTLRDYKGCPTERLVQPLTWAATGISDAGGRPIEPEGLHLGETLAARD
jgi:hypothetical protein